MARLTALAFLIAAPACSRKLSAPQKTGSVPSPPGLSCSIIQPGMTLDDLRLEGDQLRYSNALHAAPRGTPGAAITFPAGRIKASALFRHTCIVARAGGTVRYDRHETPLSLEFIAQPGGTYTLEVLGDGIPLDPSRDLPPGEPAEVEGHANLSGGPCPHVIRLGVKGAPGERIIIIEPSKPVPAPPPARPADTPRRAMRRIR